MYLYSTITKLSGILNRICMKKLFTIGTVLTILTLYSCGGAKENKEISANANLQAAKENSIVKTVDVPVERKIIKEGEISFETADVNKTKSSITKAVQELNGYLAKDEVFDYSDKIEHRLFIRVPADKFDLLLTQISENAEKLDSKNINVLDVTEQYIDIDARLKTKKELEDRYKELLKQTTKVEEILTIEKEMGQLRTDIEAVEGRLRYLKDKISLSSLTVTYYQKTHSAFGFSSKLGQGIKNGWNNLLWFFVGLINIWPFVLLIVLGIYLIMRHERRKKAKKSAT